MDFNAKNVQKCPKLFHKLERILNSLLDKLKKRQIFTFIYWIITNFPIWFFWHFLQSKIKNFSDIFKYWSANKPVLGVIFFVISERWFILSVTFTQWACKGGLISECIIIIKAKFFLETNFQNWTSCKICQFQHKIFVFKICWGPFVERTSWISWARPFVCKNW